jgi:hypothetical protein
MSNIITSAALLLAFGIFAARPLAIAEEQLHAGAFVQDITAPFDSLIINGGFTEHKRGKMNPGDLKARCFVLQQGGATIAIAVVDSCMMPRTVCDLAKELTTKATGIPPERILITATHTHSAPSTLDEALRLRIGGKGDGASRGNLILQGGERIFNGSSQTALQGWHHVVISHDGTTMTEGRNKHLNVTKTELGRNPGIAGGSIGNSQVTEAPAKD